MDEPRPEPRIGSITLSRARRAVWFRRIGRRFWRAGRFVYRATYRFILDDGLYLSSALAFSFLIAIFPFIVLLTALAGFLGGPGLANTLTIRLFDVLPSQVAEALEPEIWNVLIRDRSGVLTFGVIVMVVSVTSAVETIRGALNRAYGVVEQRSMIRTVFDSMVFIFLAIVGLVIIAFMSVIVPYGYQFIITHVPDFDLHADLSRMLPLIRLSVLAVTMTSLLWAFHRWLPAHGPVRPPLWPGIAFTIIGWYIAGRGFSYYLSTFGDYARYYAGLAGIVAALIFFYIAAVVLLFAGAFNRALAEWREERRTERRLHEHREAAERG